MCTWPTSGSMILRGPTLRADTAQALEISPTIRFPLGQGGQRDIDLDAKGSAVLAYALELALHFLSSRK